MKYPYEVGIISLSEIDVSDRYRVDYGDLDALRESIRMTDGVITAITVCRTAPGSSFPYRLVAGGRRYFASLAEKASELPARIYPADTDEAQLLLIEKLENTQRKEFEWRELVALDAAIYELQKQRHPEWTQKDLAAFLGKAASVVSENLKLHRTLQEKPDSFAGAVKLADARTVQRRLELDAQRTLAANVTKSKLDSAGSLVRLLSPRYIVRDVFEGLSELRPAQYDFIEIDPPYGIELKEKGSIGSTLEYTEVEDRNYDTFLEQLIVECIRVAKPDAWFLLWQPPQRLATASMLMNDHGISHRNVPLVWNRVNGTTLSPGTYMPHAYETALYGRLGDVKLHTRGIPDVITLPTPNSDRRIHPAERPIGLMTTVFSSFCPPGGMALSPFLGSGVAIVAAQRLNMTCMGFDLSQQHKDNFVAKLDAGWDTYTNSSTRKAQEQ